MFSFSLKPAPVQGKKKALATSEVAIPQGTGLKMKAHPLLLDSPTTPTGGGSSKSTSKKDRFKPMAPKFASTRANARMAASTGGGGSGISIEPVKANPYTSATRGGAGAGAAVGGFEGVPRERVGGKLQFNAKGKYISQGNQMRNQVFIKGPFMSLVLTYLI